MRGPAVRTEARLALGQGREGCRVLRPPLRGSARGQFPAIPWLFLLVRPQTLPQPAPSCPPWRPLSFPPSPAWLLSPDLQRQGSHSPYLWEGGPLSSLELGPAPCFTGSRDHPGAETGRRVSRSYQPCSLELQPPTPYQTLCYVIQALAGSLGSEREERKAGSVGVPGKNSFQGRE